MAQARAESLRKPTTCNSRLIVGRGAPHLLPVPVPHERRRLDDWAPQHLTGSLRVSVRRRGRTLYEGTSALAGLERGRGHLG